MGAVNLAQNLADAVYSTHVTSTGMTSLKLSIDGYTAPSGVTATPNVYIAQKATGGTAGPTSVPADATTSTSVTQAGNFASLGSVAAASTTPVVSSALTLASGASANDIFITTTAPGTYTMHFVDGGTQVGTDDDSVSPTITMKVLDAESVAGTPASFTWSPSITTSASTASLGGPITGTVDMSDLTLTDSRGSSSGAGVLGSNLSALTGLKFTSTDSSLNSDLGSAATPAAVTFATTKGTRTVPAGATQHAGPVLATALFDYDGGGFGSTANTLGTATTTVQDNHVSGVALAPTTATGTVAFSGTAVSVKTGTTAVTYKATVTDADTDKSGNVVYFTIAGTDAASVTSSGTTVDATNHIFSASTNSDGVASITLTDGATTPAGYTVIAKSNAQPSSTLTATYGGSAAQAPAITSTAGELNPTAVAGATVPLKGKIVDQFGASYTPSGNAPQQGLIYLGTAGTTCSASVITAGSTTTASATATAALGSGGTFSYTYAPTTAPTAGTCQKFALVYNADSNGVVNTGEYTEGTIYYASSTAAATISLTAPANNSTPTTLQTYNSAPAGAAVTASVYDASNGALAYRSVDLSGSDGVYFSSIASPDATHPLTKTLTAVTDNTGAVQNAYVFYTKSGTATVTAKVGSVSTTNTVTVSSTATAVQRAYKVTSENAKGKPGTVIAVHGMVTDVFGNGVQGETVNLSLSDASVGTLTTSAPVTDANGAWSTTITPGANQDGDVTLTAVLDTQTTNKAFNTAYTTAGLTLAGGSYKATSTITVGVTALTIESSEQLTYGSKYYARGALVHGSGADANASVDVYSKLPGGSYGLVDTVKADAEGQWSATEKISKSTYFLAKSGGAASVPAATHVISGVILTAKSGSKGHVTLSANGGPNAKAYLYFYRVFSNGDTDYLGKKLSSSSGNGEATFKAPKGNRKYKVLFKAPGTTTGTDTVSVKVK